MDYQIAAERRRRNQVWTGAGRYGYQPEFLANLLYMNLIIGLADRYYGGEWLQQLFGTWKEDRHQDAFDALAWLILEREIYEKTLEERPALAELRQEYALEYLGRETLKSRQEHLSADALASAVEKAHWQTVAEKVRSPLFPKEKALAGEIRSFHAEDPAQWREKFLDLLYRYYGFDGTIHADGWRIDFNRHLAALLRRVLPHQAQRTADVLQFGRAERERGRSGGGRSLAPWLGPAENDQQYVENCFGRANCSPEELAERERVLCREGHTDCHLWFTNGEQASGSKGSTESRFVAREAALQADRNRKHYQENAALYQGAIRRLAEQIRNCLLVRSESAGIPGRQGVLDPQRVWRYTALQDDHVFFRREEEPVPALSVELLLDASASRLNSQELIAAQGYIIAESLRQCGISVQVDSFCSIRRYTVLRTLKGWGRTEDSRGVFRYFAAGWNRDSLALAAAGGLLGQTNAEKRLLLVLTDAHPSDSCGLQGSGPLSLTRDYDGACAVEDTAKAVHALRREGMRVAAVFMGSTDCAENAVQIYGRQEVARIRSMDQLSDAAGKLICREILA